MNEVMIGINWLYSLLSADSTLAGLAPGGGHRGAADPETPLPCWIIALQSPGNDSLTMNGVRLMSNPLLQVKAVGLASQTAQVAEAAEQLDVLLGGEDGLRNQATANGYIASCYRESPLQSDPLVNGVKQVNIGGLYRLEIERIH